MASCRQASNHYLTQCWLRFVSPYSVTRQQRINNKVYLRLDHWWVIISLLLHDDVIKWKYFPCYWPFVWEIHRSLVNSPHKGQWRGALMFSLIWKNKRLSKQSTGGWFEKLSHSSWRQCNANTVIVKVISLVIICHKMWILLGFWIEANRIVYGIVILRGKNL